MPSPEAIAAAEAAARAFLQAVADVPPGERILLDSEKFSGAIAEVVIDDGSAGAP
ncbi:hypothetical protein [Microbacterium sp. LWO12-1.2]|uniref:hypothetical protein n=1 Tax=Microbacterium sp. LWO12-1.2 TaxID=3135261 RepID=UPI003446CB58